MRRRNVHAVACDCTLMPQESAPLAPLGRIRRVVVLLAGIIVLSVVDLVITLTHLSGAGMAEANPLARWVIEHTESPISLASFKLLTVLVCVGLLYKVRMHLQAELAAWCALGILAFMSAMWFSYSRNMDNPVELKLAQTAGVHNEWVQFE